MARLLRGLIAAATNASLASASHRMAPPLFGVGPNKPQSGRAQPDSCLAASEEIARVAAVASFEPARANKCLHPLALLWQIYSRRGSLQIHFRQCGHRCGGGRAMSSRMAWRTAGKVGWGGGPLILFFPALLLRGGDAGGRHMRSSS